jgi:hypothetical protein
MCITTQVESVIQPILHLRASEVRMTKIKTLPLLIAGFLFIAAACIATPPTHALGWSLLGVQTAVAGDNGESTGG